MIVHRKCLICDRCQLNVLALVEDHRRCLVVHLPMDRKEATVEVGDMVRCEVAILLSVGMNVAVAMVVHILIHMTDDHHLLLLPEMTITIVDDHTMTTIAGAHLHLRHHDRIGINELIV